MDATQIGVSHLLDEAREKSSNPRLGGSKRPEVTMATIEIEGGELTVRMHGFDKLLAFKSALTVPLRDVSNVTVRPADARGEGDILAVKVAGGYLPGILQTGYFWVTRGLTGGTKHALEALEAAEKALGHWKHGDKGPRERALVHLRAALQEVKGVVEEENLSTEEDKGWAFYDVHDADKTIGFDVEHHKVRRVVIEVEGESPEAAADRIRAALTGAAPYRSPPTG
jgi:hypothetical protein